MKRRYFPRQYRSYPPYDRRYQRLSRRTTRLQTRITAADGPTKYDDSKNRRSGKGTEGEDRSHTGSRNGGIREEVGKLEQ